MAFFHREEQYLSLLSNQEYTVEELAARLFVSEPTVRRDINALKKKDLVLCQRGVVRLKSHYADQRIPRNWRNQEAIPEKEAIARKAAALVKDGDVVMLDASTTAFHLISRLCAFQNILVITNGAHTAMEAVARGLKTICTGGELTRESFSYVGSDAERSLKQYHASIAFFSCRGITEDGLATDNSLLENAMRRIMIQNAKKKYLICDRTKFGKTYLQTLCLAEEVDGVITD